MTDRIEIISKTTPDGAFTGLRFYLELPVTIGGSGQGSHQSMSGPRVFEPMNGQPAQVKGPFMHHPGDDDSAAVTFWGKRDLRRMLRQALEALDEHYGYAELAGYCDHCAAPLAPDVTDRPCPGQDDPGGPCVDTAHAEGD